MFGSSGIESTKVYIPRDPTGFNIGPPGRAVKFYKSPDILHIYDELVIVDGASSTGFKIVIHIQNLFANGAVNYTLSQSNFQDQIDSVPFSNIYFKIWDNSIKNYAYYGSIENQGVINVTRYDSLNRIFSGRFSGKFVRFDNQNEFIQINDGRFDFKWDNLDNTIFQ